MTKQKWYVAWHDGVATICETWDDCQQLIQGVRGAHCKSFKTREEAIRAYRGDDSDDRQVIFAIAKAKPRHSINYASIPEIYPGSVAVDGACSGNPGMMEYRGVDIFSGRELFHVGPWPDGTNNVGEFLAIVHALALLNQQGKPHTAIYSDSRNAMGWVQKKKCNTKLAHTGRNDYIFQVIARAEQWLRTHTYTNFVIKWQTDKWGEIPADFGRK